jgi:hypothetical protein
MGTPEPDETRPDPPASSGPADWLVGPEEGLAAEMDRKSADGGPISRPALMRPGLPAPEAGPPASEPGHGGSAPPAGPKPIRRFGAVSPDLVPASDFQKGTSMTWEPGTPSSPTLRRERPAPRPEPPRRSGREFPMDDPEERARSRTAEIEGALRDALPGPKAHEVVSPEAFGDVQPAMPWWMEAAHLLGTDRRLHVLLAMVVLTLVAIAFWPRGEHSTSVSGIRHHADHYDGERVSVSGRVGQVFQVGGGYAFYLQQGDDTLVVFTRSRTPVERQRIRVTGTMSNGTLDGQPTLALFEDATAK